MEHGRAPPGASNGKAISDTTAAFITSLDNLKLNMTAVDQV